MSEMASSQESASGTPAPSSNTNGKRQRKPASVTPRTFTRFFTPKMALLQPGRKQGRSRQVLRDITRGVINAADGQLTPPTSTKKITLLDEALLEGSHGRPKKRRRGQSEALITPEASSPLKYICDGDTESMLSDNEEDEGEEQEDECEMIQKQLEARRREGQALTCTPAISRIRPSKALLGLTGRISSEIGVRRPYDSPTWLEWPARSFDSALDWRHETCRFYSRPRDWTSSVDRGQDRVVPFCAESCNNSSLVAVGKENGLISFHESEPDHPQGFALSQDSYQAHSNAILDLQFSADDSLLATASGDQTSKIIDMATKTTLFILASHCSSVKQIRFQPGNCNILATSGRDGSINMWDLRCRNRAVHGRQDADEQVTANDREARLAGTVDTIAGAHRLQLNAQGMTRSSRELSGPMTRSSPSSSVTALAFLDQTRAHLLLSGSESDASVKLWDMRACHTHRPFALSSTRRPTSHLKSRHFGISSINISTDAARLYTVCRDSTVYVYSTAHLMLGHAPELQPSPTGVRRFPGPTGNALGPIYGFRHAGLLTSTFYVRSALRKRTCSQSEILAIGSSLSTPILFPTDERYLSISPSTNTANQQSLSVSPSTRGSHRNPMSPPLPMQWSGARQGDDIPIYTCGTALVRGHTSEATGLTWTRDGNLVTASDDMSVRCWREADVAEEKGLARTLRNPRTERDVKWDHGWADCPPWWDASE